MNKTFLNMIRSMMFFKNVNLMFWGEAILCEAYIRNHFPYSVIIKKHLMNFGMIVSQLFILDQNIML